MKHAAALACAHGSNLVTSQPALQVLGTKEIERLAGWTTRAGLNTEIAGVKEVAAPYMEMNTKELLLEGAKLVKMGGVEVRPNPNPDPNPDPNRKPKPEPQPEPEPEPEPGREAGQREHPAAVVRTRGRGPPPARQGARAFASATYGVARDAVRRLSLIHI